MGFDELAFEEVGLGFTRVCGLLDGVAQRIVVIQIRHNEYYLILYFATPSTYPPIFTHPRSTTLLCPYPNAITFVLVSFRRLMNYGEGEEKRATPFRCLGGRGFLWLNFEI